MQPSAHVASLDAVRAFRGALIRFAEEVAETVVALGLEINRGVDYIEHDRMAYWPQQVRAAQDDIAEARVTLHQRRAISVAGHRPACDAEKKALAAAQQRLRFSQDKVEIVRHWCRKLSQEVEEYQGRVGHFRELTETELPRAIAALERMLSALDAYRAVGTARGDARQKESVARPDDQAQQSSHDSLQNAPGRAPDLTKERRPTNSTDGCKDE